MALIINSMYKTVTYKATDNFQDRHLYRPVPTTNDGWATYWNSYTGNGLANTRTNINANINQKIHSGNFRKSSGNNARLLFEIANTSITRLPGIIQLTANNLHKENHTYVVTRGYFSPGQILTIKHLVGAYDAVPNIAPNNWIAP